MQVGDKITISKKNRSDFGYSISAYAGMTGTVTHMWDDGGFCLSTGSSILVVSLVGKKGYWIINSMGETICHKKLEDKTKFSLISLLIQLYSRILKI